MLQLALNQIVPVKSQFVTSRKSKCFFMKKNEFQEGFLCFNSRETR